MWDQTTIIQADSQVTVSDLPHDGGHNGYVDAEKCLKEKKRAQEKQRKARKRQNIEGEMIVVTEKLRERIKDVVLGLATRNKQQNKKCTQYNSECKFILKLDL